MGSGTELGLQWKLRVLWSGSLYPNKDPVLSSTLPAANINHHMYTRQNKPC